MAKEARDIESGVGAMECALCKRGEAVELGHIIPNFVFRHLVRTSPTKFLRHYDNPNVRVQDGKKRRFLCAKCEDRLSHWERTFSRSVFHPLHKHQVTQDVVYPGMKRFEHGDWPSKFCVAASWRSLHDLMLDNGHEPLPCGDHAAAERALAAWRKALIDERAPLEGFEQHLVVVGAPVEARGIENSLDLKLFLERGVTYVTWHSPTESYVITKMCRIVIVGTIKDSERAWRQTLVRPGSGVFAWQEQTVPGIFGDWMRHDAGALPKARDRISRHQAGIIGNAVNEFLARQQTNIRNGADSHTRQE
jgi:hypothetical protein